MVPQRVIIIMTIELITVLLVYGSYGADFLSAFADDINFDRIKVAVESSFFTSKIWTEYSKLLSIDGKDLFCHQNPGYIFSDNTAKDLYYRCRNGKKELYQCMDGFEFDKGYSGCLPKGFMYNEVGFQDCSHQMNGFYPDHHTNCQEYYRCENGMKVDTFKCSAGEFFSFHHQSCQRKTEATCPMLNCHENNDDFFIYPGSKCQAYYYCKKGLRFDFLCPRGTIFDISTKTCSENGICYEPVCAGRIDGTYTDTTHDCKRSFDCKGGVLEVVNICPLGKKHNGIKCVPSDVYDCERPEKAAAVFYFRSDDECKNLKDGVHIKPGTDCRKLQVCLRGKTVTTFECSGEERFFSNSCLPRDLVSCDDICSMKPDGDYPDEVTDCRSYYTCINEKMLSKKLCPKGTAFNGYICVPSSLVSCPKKSKSYAGRCLGLRDGFHPDYLNSCQKYFYCYNHEMVLSGSCEEGWLYNGKECVKKDLVLCEGPEELLECSGLPPGLYRNKTSDCSKYYYCSNGIGTKLSCPKGQVFDHYKCVSEDEFTCSTNDDCEGEMDGYKQDNDTACRSYHYCSNGNKITYVCPDNMVFNGTTCVFQKFYECPFTPSEDCKDKSDGYHPDEKSACKDYYYCLKNEKLNTLTCSGKKIFNGKGCTLVSDPISACADFLRNPCKKKKDGLYADTKTNCRKYYTCKGGVKLSESWCPKSYGFDGTECQMNFVCSSKNDCEGKSIGFYQDLSSQCRSYYFCFFNTKTVGICPTGTIFNGYLCIDSNYYVCPTKKT